MLSLSWLFYIIFTILFIVFVRVGKRFVKYLIYLEKINKLPGPPSLFLIGNVLDIRNHQEILPKICSLWKQYRSRGLFRLNLIKMTYVFPTIPENVEVILSSSHFIDKSDMYKYSYPWLGINLLTSGGNTWKLRRKLLTPAFHFQILDGFVEVFNKHSEILAKKLAPHANGKVFDMLPFITLCALDIICETAMGSNKINAQENEDSEYVQALYKICRILIQRMLNPIKDNEIIFRLSADGREHSKCLKILHKFTNQVIAERKEQFKKRVVTGVEGNKKRMAFLDVLLESTLDKGILTDEDLRNEVDTFMFEGHDTTSSGLLWTLYLLGNHPEIQSKVHEELDEIFGKEDRPVTSDDLHSLKYLERVIKESLRIYTPVPMIGRQLFEDLKIDNYTIPKGSSVIICPFCVHRNPNVFPDPEKFDPDRFLTENIVGRHPFAYIPFSAGPRNCIGQKFALMEEKIVLAQVLRKYKVESIEPPDKITLLADVVLRPSDGFKMRLYRR